MKEQVTRDRTMPDDDRGTILAALDPGRDNPGYWRESRARIMDRVAFELARRRAAARASVAQVLSGWSRSLIPAAAAAAVIAAVVVTSESRRAPEPPEARLVLQDVLGDTVDETGLEALLASDRTASAGAFMALVEGMAP